MIPTIAKLNQTAAQNTKMMNQFRWFYIVNSVCRRAGFCLFVYYFLFLVPRRLRLYNTLQVDANIAHYSYSNISTFT